MSPATQRPGPWRDRFFDGYSASIPLIWANVAWFLLSLPVITLFPALAGLYHATHLIATDRDSGGRAVWDGFLAHFWLGWRWGLLLLAGIAVLGANILFYGRLEAQWAWLPRALFFTLLVFWLALNIYTFPLLLLQEEQRLRTALRNSLVLWIQRPFYSLLLLAACSLLIWASTFFFPFAWLFLTGSLCAYLSNRVVLETVAASREDEQRG